MGGFLGKVALLAPRSSFPLGFHHAAQITAQRLALVGDSAHAIHPIAGQGLNLGFRDVAALAQVVVEGARLGLDLGDKQLLDRYQRWRSFDALSVAFATDTLTRIYGVPGQDRVGGPPLRHGTGRPDHALAQHADERSARHQRRPSVAAPGTADLTEARRFPSARHPAKPASPCLTPARHHQAAPLSRRRVELHLPRLSPAAAADQPPRPAGGRGLWLYDDAVEARRRPVARRRADPHGGDPRRVGAYPPQRDVRPV